MESSVWGLIIFIGISLCAIVTFSIIGYFEQKRRIKAIRETAHIILNCYRAYIQQHHPKEWTP